MLNIPATRMIEKVTYSAGCEPGPRPRASTGLGPINQFAADVLEGFRDLDIALASADGFFQLRVIRHGLLFQYIAENSKNKNLNELSEGAVAAWSKALIVRVDKQ